MFVLGIDPGVSRCGYGAVRQEGGHPVAVVSGVLTTPPSQPLEQRLAELLKEFRQLLGRLSPEVVVVERVLFQANARTAMAVGQASGLALAAAAEIGIPVMQYSPNEVKQAVTGWGNAGKDQVQRMVQALLDLPEKPTPPDRADALALALCYLASAPLARAAAAAEAKAGARCGRCREPALIGSLRGTLLDRALRTEHQAEVLVEVGGVGYRVVIPAGCASRAGELGGPTFLHVHTHVREDALILYGFPSREERDCFELLLGAHGVGPAVAVALLSVLSPASLRRAVLAEDADALTLVPGIGKRTAARLILELTARFEAAAVIDIARPGAAAAGLSGDAATGGPGDEGPHEASAADRAVQREEVRVALVSLGYGPEEVRQALARLPVEGGTEQLLRHALRELAGQS